MRRDRVIYGDITLPPCELRSGGPDFGEDAFFLASARAEADRLVRAFALSKKSRVLDIGCGVGRLAIGILSRVGQIEKYRGVDVNRRSIRWCRRYLEGVHPSFRFVRINVRNPRYNPSGRALSPNFRLPFANREFDVVYLYSVFSHMPTADVRIYLQESRRVLAPSGGLFFTAFAESDVPEVSVNPEGYRREWTGPLHCVRYNREFLQSLLSENGFTLAQTDYATETDGQSAFYATIALRLDQGSRHDPGQDPSL
jgi:SAM-dependent methyltransferase